MRYENKKKHERRDALTSRCKQATGELQGAIIRANTVTFFSARSENDGINFNEFNSRAGRFEQLLQSARRMKLHILLPITKAGCVTPAMEDQVAGRFLGFAPYYRQVYGAIKDRRLRGEHIPPWDWEQQRQTLTVFCEAIGYPLELASSHPRFDSLEGEASTSPHHIFGKKPPFCG